MNLILIFALSVLTLGVIVLGMILFLCCPNKNSNRPSPCDPNSMIGKLDKYMTEDLRCPRLEKNGVVRVYVSGGMFDISDTVYSIGPDGMKPGLDYQSINLVDMICNFSDDQWSDLKDLCTLWDVPWYGVAGEIEKMGWECFCPVRDGITMATVAAAISECTYDQVVQQYDATEAGVRPWSESMFNPKNIEKFMKKKNPTKDEVVSWAIKTMNGALGTNVGANDLYNMYSTCNSCIMNYNGIQADAGAIAEVGQLGARGVPCVILKGTFTGDFGGISNPMPVMATTSGYTLLPNLTNNPGSVYSSWKTGALPHLKNKVNQLIQADIDDNTDPMTFGNYNNEMPLPPLQIFWADLGSKVFFLKHRKKSIATLSNGKTNFEKDYTDFWYNSVVKGGVSGLVQLAKAMADNLDKLQNEPRYKNVHKYWD